MSGPSAGVGNDRSTMSRSGSVSSVSEDPPSKPKRERNALSQKFTKLSLFGKKRGKDTLTAAALSEYIQQDTHVEPPQDDTSSSVCEEEGGTSVLWEDDGNVKAATPQMLIRRITDEKFVDSNLLTDVIVSYPYLNNSIVISNNIWEILISLRRKYYYLLVLKLIHNYEHLCDKSLDMDYIGNHHYHLNQTIKKPKL